jgi:heme-degrading monooxygenase HmoA
MHARVSTYQFAPDAIDKASEQFDSAMNELDDDLKGAVLLADRTTGKGMTITYWESQETLASSRQTADRVRNAATQAASGSIESVEEYEVLLQR